LAIVFFRVVGWPHFVVVVVFWFRRRCATSLERMTTTILVHK